MILFLTCAIAFVYIFLKASQQINVVRGRYRWIMPTSVGMGLCEVTTVLLVVRADTLWLGIAIGISSGLGCILAMKLHKMGKA